MNKYKEGDVVKARITAVERYGAFAAIDDEYSGLIHISEFTGALFLMALILPRYTASTILLSSLSVLIRLTLMVYCPASRPVLSMAYRFVLSSEPEIVSEDPEKYPST